MVDYVAGVMPSGEKLTLKQPIFAAMKNTLSMQLASDEPVLIGVHKVPGDDARLELFILRIRADSYRRREVTMRGVIVGFACLLLVKASGGADPPAANLRVDVQMVSVSPAVAVSLVPALRDEKTVEEAYAKVQTMIARDEAKLLGWPMVCTRSGFRAVSETNEEMRHDTEPDSVHPPQNFESGFQPFNWRRVDMTPMWGPHIPVAFETANLGPTLDVEPTVDEDGRTVGLNIVARFQRFLTFRSHLVQASPIGIEGVIQRPEFARSTVTTTVSVRSGRPTLLGGFVQPKPEPHVELFLLRATITESGRSVPTPAEK